MEKTRIGLNAGKVWRILNEKGELSMFDLCRELGLTFEDVALAIGWLARESKVFLRKNDYSYFFPAILFIVYLFLSDRLLNSFFIYFIKGYSVDCLMEEHR